MELDLRPATLDDAGFVADLETAATPDDPHGGEMVRYWWTHDQNGRHARRLVGEVVYASARHADWEDGRRRFGLIHVVIHPSAWSPDLHRDALSTVESWLREEGAQVLVSRVRADRDEELQVTLAAGYLETRRHRQWELDLVARREQLLATAEVTRARMREEGVALVTLAEDDSPETLQKIYEVDVESTKDIPVTVPITMPPFDEWYRNYFENPGTRKDRFWIARAGGDVAGMSLIEYPPDRGVPATEYTGISPRYRGRGIAKALKYETVAQAIAVGATHVRTDNDSQNAPILHINAEMGYTPRPEVIELHREL